MAAHDPAHDPAHNPVHNKAGSHQSKEQKDIVGRVMHEFKQGDLETHGRTVKNPKQAIAIALHEAGASRDETPARNRENLKRTKKRERDGKS